VNAGASTNGWVTKDACGRTAFYIEHEQKRRGEGPVTKISSYQGQRISRSDRAAAGLPGLRDRRVAAVSDTRAAGRRRGARECVPPRQCREKGPRCIAVVEKPHVKKSSAGGDSSLPPISLLMFPRFRSRRIPRSSDEILVIE
jgi:hypothetical protein